MTVQGASVMNGPTAINSTLSVGGTLVLSPPASAALLELRSNQGSRSLSSSSSGDAALGPRIVWREGESVVWTLQNNHSSGDALTLGTATGQQALRVAQSALLSLDGTISAARLLKMHCIYLTQL